MYSTHMIIRQVLAVALVALFAICFLQTFSPGQELPTKPFPVLQSAGYQQCVLAGQEAQFGFSLVDGSGENLRVGWSLVSKGRILARGSSNALCMGDGSEAMPYSFTIPIPKLREGVVLPVELKITLAVEGQNLSFTHQLYIYSRDPFPAQKAFLEQAKIKLFDSDGKTAALLEENEIPHTRLLNLAAIDLVTEGIVLVGEGVSFRKQRKLAKSLMQAASRGVSVLCLAPSEGDFPLMVDGHDLHIRPRRFAIADGDFVRRYDKRFDTIASLSNLSLTSRRNEVVISVGEGADHWSWLNLDIPARKTDAADGRLMICCLGIVSRWDSSPVPRHLFAHLLQELTENSSTEGEIEK